MKRILFGLAALCLASCSTAAYAQTPVSVAPTSSPTVSGGWVAASTRTDAYRLAASSSSTAGYFMVFDATTVPADGAVVPKFCRAVAAGASVSLVFVNPAAFRNGIVMVFSTTGCYTKTISATAFFEASFK